MKASDTVMSQIQRDNIFYHGIGTLEGVCKLQAEISFKAGIKEVVEWILERATKIGTDGGRFSAVSMDKEDYLEMTFHISSGEWQSKLKEWQIKITEGLDGR